MSEQNVTVELARGEVLSLVGIVQLEKKRTRSKGDDETAEQLGEIQQKLIAASNDGGST